MGLMGYVGEAVVDQWLRKKYPASEGFRIIQQVRPAAIPASGGPYVDFAVVRGNDLIALYEVKSQDYIIDKSFKLNDSLLYVWAQSGKELEFGSQVGQRFKGSASTEAYLVLLVGPNKDAIANIGAANLSKIILFSEIWEDLGWELDERQIFDVIGEDVLKVLEILKRPTQGRRVKKAFLQMRSDNS
jgi:hypothetical protein